MEPATHHLRTLTHHLRAAVDQIDEGVVIMETEPVDSGGPRVVFVNRGICSLTGFRGEDLLGCPLATLFKGEKLQLLLDRLSAVADSGRAFLVDSPLGREGGATVPARWKVSCVYDADRQPLHFMLTVATGAADAPAAQSDALGAQSDAQSPSAQSGAAAEAPQARPAPAADEIQVRVLDGAGDAAGGAADDDQLRSARMETLALLAGGIAHDFKNILTTVMANLSLVRRSMGEGDLREQIDDAAKASEAGCRMAEQLLAFARGGENGERVEADVGRLLTEAARLSTYGAKARCDVSIDEGLWSAVINVTQVTQIINNLIINARQAMGDVGTFQTKLGNVTLEPDEVEGLSPGSYLRLDVIDHGCGIPAEKLGDIFTPFYTTKKTGNGLGLATCQTVVREHGGLIAVESEEGRGACFSVFLPATGEPVEAEEEEADGEIFRGAGAVLVVDDQKPILRVAKALLEQLGYEVDCAPTGEEGVARFRRRRSEGRPFGAVLMDMTLPGGIDGREATERILAIDADAKVIASSGYLQDDMSEEQRNCGFVAVLSKPYDLEKVSRVMHGVFQADGILD